MNGYYYLASTTEFFSEIKKKSEPVLLMTCLSFY